MAHFVMVDSLRPNLIHVKIQKNKQGATGGEKKKQRQIFPLEAEVLLQDNST